MKRFALLLAFSVTLPICAAAAPAPAQGVHYIYLIRHGIYDRDTTQDDIIGNGLNALGHEQAALVAQRLAALPVKLNGLVCSDYLRAIETADDMGHVLGLMAVRDSLLHECTPTSDRADLMRDLRPDEIALCETNLKAAFAKYFRATPRADTRDVLVAHGNVIRWLVGRALGMRASYWIHMEIANCSITVIAVRPDGTRRLVAFSDTGHLPPEKQTWTGKGAGWSVPATK
jgi:serine/threonine-protein phosphatase PGAM5